MSEVKLLVVDDSVDLVQLITIVVDQPDRGWRVVGTAADGRQAIESARAGQPDLVLLDVAMPVMDGIEALPHIREAVPDASIVMLSGYPAETYEATALAAGAHGYLEKSDLVATLVPKLEEILADRTLVTRPQPGGQSG